MLAYVPGAGCGMISKPRFYLVGLGGITGRDFLSLAFRPGLAKGYSPALTGDNSREMKVCSARLLASAGGRGPKTHPLHSPAAP